MYMTVDNGTDQMTINTATLYGTALLSMTAGIIDLIVNKTDKPIRISGFGSVYDYLFTMKGHDIKIEAVNVTNDRVEFFLVCDKLKFARDLGKALKDHLQQIAQINIRVKEQETYKLLEQSMDALNTVLERYS
jgi:hypothetical protein